MRYATPVERLSSGILDVLIFFLSLALFYWLSTLVFGEWGGSLGHRPGVIAIIVFNIIEIPLLFMYFIYLPSKKGSTLGGQIVGIKMVNKNGKTPSLLVILIRETIGRVVSVMFFSLGYLWMLWDPRKQTWHDKITDTYVVKR